MIKSKKKLVISIVALLAVALIGGTMAYYTSTLSVDNTLKTKGYGSELVEKFTPKDDWQPGAEINKDVAVKNTGNYPLLARVTWTETWKKADDSKETVTLKQEKENTATSQVIKNLVNGGANWLYNDGYYYYNGTIAEGQKANFLDSVKLKDDVDMTGTATVKYAYSKENTEPTVDKDWTWVDKESDIPTDATFKKVVSSPAKNSYGNATYTLTITTQVLQATKTAVDGTADWAAFKTVCSEVYNNLPAE